MTPFFVLLSPSGWILRVEPSCLCYWGLYGGHASPEKWDQGCEVRRTETQKTVIWEACVGYLTELTPLSVARDLTPALHVCLHTECHFRRVLGVVAKGMTVSWKEPWACREKTGFHFCLCESTWVYYLVLLTLCFSSAIWWLQHSSKRYVCESQCPISSKVL